MTSVVRVVVVGASHTLSHSPRQICHEYDYVDDDYDDDDYDDYDDYDDDDYDDVYDDGDGG